MHDPKIGSIFPGELEFVKRAEPNRCEMVNAQDAEPLAGSARGVCCLKGTLMRNDMLKSEAPATGAIEGLFSHDGARLGAQRVMHEAIADVEEGLQFWKTIAGKVRSKRRVSREFLNRQG
jgi:hypothetical protein